jgi:hypothetical protein
MRMRKAVLAAVTGLLCLAAAGARAEDDYVPGTTHAGLDFGLSYGGDKIVTQHYLIGGYSTLYAGKGLFLGFGPQHNFADSDWSFKATVGIYRGFTTALNSTTFTRYPLNLLFQYNVGRQHLGFGLTYHANPKLDENNDGPDVAFHDAVGGILQYQYSMFGLRYTYVRYTVSGACPFARCSYDGSSLALYLNAVF